MHNSTRLLATISLAWVTLFGSAGCKDSSSSNLTDLGHSHLKYKPGQAWRYRARPGEEQSTLTVLRVEVHPTLGTIVHVRLDGLRIRNPKTPGGHTETATHLPFSEKAVDDSVLAVSALAGPVPDYQEGYTLWRKSFDAGKGGVFTISVSEAVDGMEKGLATGTAG